MAIYNLQVNNPWNYFTTLFRIKPVEKEETLSSPTLETKLQDTTYEDLDPLGGLQPFEPTIETMEWDASMTKEDIEILEASGYKVTNQPMFFKETVIDRSTNKLKIKRTLNSPRVHEWLDSVNIDSSFPQESPEYIDPKEKNIQDIAGNYFRSLQNSQDSVAKYQGKTYGTYNFANMFSAAKKRWSLFRKKSEYTYQGSQKDIEKMITVAKDLNGKSFVVENIYKVGTDKSGQDVFDVHGRYVKKQEQYIKWN